MRRRLVSALVSFGAALLASCGGSAAGSPDEDALRARIREEVLEELRRENAARRGGERSGAQAQLPPDGIERLRVEPGDSPSLGATEPLVTIVAFSDFQCPFCRHAAPTVARLVREFPDEVRVVFRHNPLPFHRNALPAAEAAVEAYEQGGAEMFWRFHDLLFENQRALSRADLEIYARQVGADPQRFAAALDSHTHRARIREDQAVTQRLGARGTPAFFINGRPLMGAQPYEAFSAIVREEVTLARRALERGVPRATYYAALMERAREAPPADEGRGAEFVRRERELDPDAVYRVPVRGRPQLGPDDALVTIVEFSDFQCPFCSRVLPTLEEVRQRYGNDVRIVFRHNPLPFHDHAMAAAEAAEEVYRQLGSSGFFAYADRLFRNQRILDTTTLVRLAGEVGADLGEVERALSERRHRSTIEADQDLTRSLGAVGTPTFFINGRELRGAQPFVSFEAAIDDALRRAQARVRQGTPRADVYEALIRDGATSPQFIGEGSAL